MFLHGAPATEGIDELLGVNALVGRVEDDHRLLIAEAVGVRGVGGVAERLDALQGPAPTPLMPLPFLMVTIPVRVFAEGLALRAVCAPHALALSLAAAFAVADAGEHGAVQLVHLIGLGGGKPSRTRPIMVFHAATSSCSYHVSFLYSLIVGSMAE